MPLPGSEGRAVAQETPRLNRRTKRDPTSQNQAGSQRVLFSVHREEGQRLWGTCNNAALLQTILDCHFLVHLLALASGPNYIICKQQLRDISH